MRARVRAVLRSALLAAGAVVLPVACAGCGRDDVALCTSCREHCAAAVRVEAVDGVPVHVALDYAGVVARVVVAFKNHGRTGLGRVLAEPFGTSVDAAMAVASPGTDVVDVDVDVDGTGTASRNVVIVAVPSRRASMRRRGYRPVALLARRAGVDLSPLLRFTRQPLDQLRLDRRARSDNVRSAMSAAAGVEGRHVLIVDDVLTTGSTLREAMRAVEAAGGVVVGAAVLARTPPGRRASRRVAGLLGAPSESP